MAPSQQPNDKKTGDGVGNEGGEARPKDRKVLFDLQHLATVGAIVLILFAVMKAYATAKFSLTSASAMLITAPLNVLLGTVVSYSYKIFPLLGLAAVAWAYFTWKETGPVAKIAASATAILAFLLSPLRELLLPIVVIIIAFVMIAVARRWPSFKQWPSVVVWGIFVFYGLYIVLTTAENLWLPAEALIYRGQGGVK